MSEKPISVQVEDVSRGGRTDYENQLIGMRELFTGIISQNKREYDVQLNEMKLVFTNILNETREAFQEQIQSLYISLPKLVRQKPLSETTQQERPPVDPMRELVTLEALRDMLLGEEMGRMKGFIDELAKEAGHYRNEGDELLDQLSQEFSTAFQMIEESIMEAIGLLVDKIQHLLVEWDKKIILRKTVGNLFEQVANSISLPD